MFDHSPRNWRGPVAAAIGLVVLVAGAGLLVRRRMAGGAPSSGGTGPLPRRKVLTAPTKILLRRTKDAIRRTKAAAEPGRTSLRRGGPSE